MKDDINDKLNYSSWVLLLILSSPLGARAERGLLTNLEDTIPGPSDSIVALKMYILEKRNLGPTFQCLDFYYYDT